jgi:hypothetical protein
LPVSVGVVVGVVVGGLKADYDDDYDYADVKWPFSPDSR